MVPALSHKVSRVSWYSGYCSASSRFVYGALTLSGRSFQNRSTTIRSHKCSPNPGVHALRFGLFPFRSPLLWKSSFLSRKKLFFLFLRLLRCFSSPGSLRMTIGIAPFHHTVTEVCSAGFPHSEIHGSGLICSSPWLFAAYHVFLRLLVPRHPPCALVRLTISFHI